MKIKLPIEIWILIYEYEGLYYKYIDLVKQEIQILSHICNCEYIGVCPIHWDLWKISVRILKNKAMPNITLLPNGIWNWRDIPVPKWLIDLKNKKIK